MMPKKHLGQHFLSHRSILEMMVRAAHVTKRDVVLEVGPGKGSLTEILAKYAKKVIAIEKDRDLIPLLREKFSEIKNIEIVEGDVLNLASLISSPLQGEARRGKKLKFTTSREKLRPLAFLPSPPRRRRRVEAGFVSLPANWQEGRRNNNYKLQTINYKLVSNIPYYLTGRLIRLFLESPHKPSIMVLMIQREVAERIVGKRRPSTKLRARESLLSISVKVYGTPKIIRIVPRGAFNPPPKVDSAIIAIDNISEAWFVKNRIKSSDFFAVLRKAFQNKRKMLKNSLRDTHTTNYTSYAKWRPEELSLEDWKEIITSP